MGETISMTTKISPGYRCDSPTIAGRYAGARQVSPPIVLLGLCTEANYKIKYLLTNMHRLTNLLHPESRFFGDGFLRTVSIGLTIFVCI